VCSSDLALLLLLVELKIASKPVNDNNTTIKPIIILEIHPVDLSRIFCSMHPPVEPLKIAVHYGLALQNKGAPNDAP
jgi:hypothetical protein